MEEQLFLQTLGDALTELEAIPLWGSPPPFPWKEFSSALAKALEQKKLELTHRKTEWLSSEAFLDGMGDTPSIQGLHLTPLPGSLFWIMPTKSQDLLVKHLLTKGHKSPSGDALREGFYHFLLLNILDTFNRENPFSSLSASLSEATQLPQNGGLCIDVSIALDDTTLSGRIVLSQETPTHFKSHFKSTTAELLTHPSFATSPLSLQIEAGSTILSTQAWSQVSVGDFVLLDRCTYDIQNHRGNAILTVGTSPLFDVRIKEGEVKILEYALLQEEKPMTESSSPEGETPVPENTPKEPQGSPLEENSEQSPLWASENGTEDSEQLLSSKDIPITLTVEVGRYKLPLEKVTQLKPGNVLNLNLAPQPTVHLTIEGKRVAKGELVNLGEALGVKILNLGD